MIEEFIFDEKFYLLSYLITIIKFIVLLRYRHQHYKHFVRQKGFLNPRGLFIFTLIVGNCSMSHIIEIGILTDVLETWNRSMSVWYKNGQVSMASMEEFTMVEFITLQLDDGTAYL